MKVRRSFPVNVNGIDIDVADLRLFGDNLPQGWQPLPNTNWAYEMSDAYKLLQAAGHNVGVIDLAVPQSWWDEQFKKIGKAPRACWTYEKNKLFGEPLWWDTVRFEFERELRKVWAASSPQI